MIKFKINEFFNRSKTCRTKRIWKSFLEIFLKLKNSTDKNNEILFYLGLIYFELNNYKKSIYFYNKFLKKNQTQL